jgi:hypothetical protein
MAPTRSGESAEMPPNPHVSGADESGKSPQAIISRRQSSTHMPIHQSPFPKEGLMAIGTSVFLLAVGAILRFAVAFRTNAVAIPIVGDILMVVGALGLFVGLFFFGPWSTRSRRESSTVRSADGSTVVREEAAVTDGPSW